MKTLRMLGVALLVCATACSRKSPDEQLVKSIGPAAGWVPALRMTAEKWLDNSVPPTFVASVSKAARKELEKARQTLEESKASPQLRDRIRADLQKTDAFARKLQSAVEKDDRSGMAGELLDLPRLQSDFESIRKQYGGSS